MLLFLLGCAPGPGGGGPGDEPPEGADTGAEADTGWGGPAPAPPQFELGVDRHLPLPFVTTGQDPPYATLIVDGGEAGSGGPLILAASPPFALSGDTGPLRPGERRELLLSFTGGTGEPGWWEGTASVAVDGRSSALSLAAVVGVRGLPEGVDWTVDGYGLHTIAALPSAPFADGGDWDDASVLIALPPGATDGADRQHVTHLHGYYAVLEDIAAEHALVEQHALSGRDALLVVPQGPLDAASSDFGQLDRPGGHYALLRDAVSLLYRDGWIAHPGLGSGVITAHSGGYLSASYLLLGGDLPILAVHLFDALYGQSWVFEDFALGGGRLRSGYTDSGGTADENEALLAALTRGGLAVGRGFADDELAAWPSSVGYLDSTHMASVTDDRSYARWLAASGLRRRPSAPPELVSARSDGGGTAELRWLGDAGGEPSWRVEGSEDGVSWRVLAELEPGARSAEVDALPYLRLRAVDAGGALSDPSDTYGATGGDWLVVDGFDRVLWGSWTQPTHGFAADLGRATGRGFSAASNEAVSTGAVDLGDYSRVLWFLGDESTGDRTLDPWEMAAIEDYLDGGGRLIFSGSELGYAGDRRWLEERLGARYVADDAGSDTAGGYTFGVAYEEDYPDVLDGEVVLWEYGSSGGAAVGRDRQIITVGFPLETLSPEDIGPAVQELASWLD